MKQQVLKNVIKSVALVAALAVPAVSHAQVTMLANDAVGTTSFNAAGEWSSAAAPAAGSTYSTLGYLLRSPTTAGSYTFAGDSLTIGGGNGGGANPFSGSTANNNALIFKITGLTLTVNNLILDGGQIRDGDGNGNVGTLDGNILITANGGAIACQQTNIINSAISGSGTLYIANNGNGSSQRIAILTSGASTFNGNILMDSGAAAGFAQLAFTAGSIMNFTIAGNGVNNNISGVGTLQLQGNFAFNLSGADNTIGDSWDIVDSGTTTTYGGTFGVNGFTQNGVLWNEVANGVVYDFSQTTGLLTVQAVPEPTTLALCGLGFAGLLGWKRRSK